MLQSSPSAEEKLVGGRDAGERYRQFVDRFHAAQESLPTRKLRKVAIVASLCIPLALPLIGCWPNVNVRALELGNQTTTEQVPSMSEIELINRTGKIARPTNNKIAKLEKPFVSLIANAEIEVVNPRLIVSTSPIEVSDSEVQEIISTTKFEGFWTDNQKETILEAINKAVLFSANIGVPFELTRARQANTTIKILPIDSRYGGLEKKGEISINIDPNNRQLTDEYFFHEWAHQENDDVKSGLVNEAAAQSYAHKASGLPFDSPSVFKCGNMPEYFNDYEELAKEFDNISRSLPNLSAHWIVATFNIQLMKRDFSYTPTLEEQFVELTRLYHQEGKEANPKAIFSRQEVLSCDLLP